MEFKERDGSVLPDLCICIMLVHINDFLRYFMFYIIDYCLERVNMKNRLRTYERLINKDLIYLFNWMSERRDQYPNILLLRYNKEKGRLCVYECMTGQRLNALIDLNEILHIGSSLQNLSGVRK